MRRTTLFEWLDNLSTASRLSGNPNFSLHSILCAMASLFLRSVSAAARGTTRFLGCVSASRLFSAWLLGRSQIFSPSQALSAPRTHGPDQKPFLTRCPLPGLQCVAGMKSKLVLRRRCKDCFFVRRRGRLYIYCKTHPRHKQRQF